MSRPVSHVEEWSDEERAEDLRLFSENDEPLWVECERLERVGREEDWRDYWTRVAFRYNRECLRGFRGVDMRRAVEVLVAESAAS